jgi:hypothetical protein
VPIDHPACRAAIRGEQITLNRWSRGLLSGGPERVGMRTIDVALADLRALGDELVVSPVPRAPWTEEAETTLLAWAAVVGYRRVWLPLRVVDLDGALAPLARAAVRCPTCGATWEDDTVVFWERVRRDGGFPGNCLACGGSLPEWGCHAVSPAEDDAASISAAKVSERGRRERHH